MATVTDDMVTAASLQLPGVRNPRLIRRALEQAMLAAPPVEQTCEVPVTALIRIVVDEAAFHASAVEAVHQLRAGLPLTTDGKISLADLEAQLDPRIRSEHGPELDHFDRPGYYVARPDMPGYPALAETATGGIPRPAHDRAVADMETPAWSKPAATKLPTLAGLSEIAEATGAGRSTVHGWVKNAAAARENREFGNGMPAPLAELACGPIFDLDAVVAWHKEWKSGGSTTEANDAGR